MTQLTTSEVFVSVNLANEEVRLRLTISEHEAEREGWVRREDERNKR